MSNFAEDIEEAVGLEAIEAVMIKDLGYGMDERHAPSLARKDEVLPWHVARPLLDYKYDAGYGGQDCTDIFVWTATRVLFVWEYDGSTHIASVPRNPSGSSSD